MQNHLFMIFNDIGKRRVERTRIVNSSGHLPALAETMIAEAIRVGNVREDGTDLVITEDGIAAGRRSGMPMLMLND